MRNKIPNLKLGEGVEKLDVEISKENLICINKVAVDVRNDGIQEKSIKDKYTTPLRIYAYILNKNFNDCTREDNKAFNGWLNSSGYGYYSKEKMRIAIKRLYRVINNSDEDLELTRDLKQAKKERRPITEMPKNMNKTDEDNDKVLNYFKNDRDKFRNALGWNIAGRCIEINNSKWKDIYSKDGYLKIELTTAKCSGDTAKRNIMLSYALPYYHRWKSQYKEIFGIKKDEDLEDLYIFRDFNGKKNEPLGHQYWLKVYKEAGNKAGIKNYTPKIQRKEAISRWQRQGIPDALIKIMVGHSKDSKQLGHYSFHTEDECDTALRKAEGLDTRQEIITPKASIISCKRCIKENSIKDENCQFCGFPLTEEALLKQNLKKDEDLENLKKEQREFKKQITEQFKIMQEAFNKEFTNVMKLNKMMIEGK